MSVCEFNSQLLCLQFTPNINCLIKFLCMRFWLLMMPNSSIASN